MADGSAGAAQNGFRVRCQIWHQIFSIPRQTKTLSDKHHARADPNPGARCKQSRGLPRLRQRLFPIGNNPRSAQTLRALSGNRPIAARLISAIPKLASLDIERSGAYPDYSALGVIHPNGRLEDKPWGVREFSILDADGNLITFQQT